MISHVACRKVKEAKLHGVHVAGVRSGESAEEGFNSIVIVVTQGVLCQTVTLYSLQFLSVILKYGCYSLKIFPPSYLSITNGKIVILRWKKMAETTLSKLLRSASLVIRQRWHQLSPPHVIHQEGTVPLNSLVKFCKGSLWSWGNTRQHKTSWNMTQCTKLAR